MQSSLDFSCKALQLSAPPAIQSRLMEAYLHLQTFPEVGEALKALSAYPRAILSNGTSNMLKAIVSNASLGKGFSLEK
jgi:2-haloacid dehalogenase